MRIYFNRSPLRRILTGIFSQCINHKQGQCTIGLYHQGGRFDFQLLLFHFKSTPSFSQQIKQFIQTECLNVQTKRTLLHLDPKCQNIIVFVDGSHQFINVLVLLFLYLGVINISFFRQLMYFVQNPVDIRINPVDDGHTSLLYQILTFVSCNMLLVDIPLFLQLISLVAQRSHHLFIFSSPYDIRFHYMHQCLLVPVQSMGRRYQCSFSFFRNFQRQTSFPEQLVNALLNQRYVHRYGRSGIPTKRENPLQTLHIHLIPDFGTFVEEPPKDNHQYQADNNQKKNDRHLSRTCFQRQITAFQLLILTGKVQNIQIDIPVIIRSILHPQPGI